MEQLKENKLLDNFTKWVNNKGYIINFESFLEKIKEFLHKKIKVNIIKEYLILMLYLKNLIGYQL